MTSTTVAAALTIAEQDIFATSAEWDTPQTHTIESIRHESSTSAAESQQHPESESQPTGDAEYDISQDRQFQKFLRRFGGTPVSSGKTSSTYEFESESQSITDAETEYDISQDRQFQKFLRRFGGSLTPRAATPPVIANQPVAMRAKTNSSKRPTAGSEEETSALSDESEELPKALATDMLK
ncbi:hypothetical protein BGZ96_010420, partial [Linnemannia gamsii]